MCGVDAHHLCMAQSMPSTLPAPALEWIADLTLTVAAPTFEMSGESLRGMTENVFIGTSARSPDRVEEQFFRVC